MPKTRDGVEVDRKTGVVWYVVIDDEAEELKSMPLHRIHPDYREDYAAQHYSTPAAAVLATIEDTNRVHSEQQKRLLDMLGKAELAALAEGD